jgi:hypothetical protein
MQTITVFFTGNRKATRYFKKTELSQSKGKSCSFLENSQACLL